jgi:hypothetical protein
VCTDVIALFDSVCQLHTLTSVNDMKASDGDPSYDSVLELALKNRGNP